MRSHHPAARQFAERGGLLAAILLATALVLGGGGSPAPLPELVLELIAAAVAAIWLLGDRTGEALARVPRSAWILVGLIAVVPALQLIPLPPTIWQALPGRELQRDALALIGAEGEWRSLSLAPHRTLASLLSLLPPLALLAMTASLGKSSRDLLVGVVVATGLAALVLGALQLSSGDASPVHLYGVVEPRLAGFQANHNSTADFMLVCMIATALLVRNEAGKRLPDRQPVVLAVAGGAILLFALGVVFTTSRTGIALLPIALGACILILRRWFAFSGRTMALGAAAIVAAAVLALALARTNPVLSAVLARFEFSQELRPQLWRDGIYVVQKYFPFGTGMGDFVPALIADERLEVVRASMPNRAHNDYIELAAEAGAIGIAALLACAWIIARSALKGLRQGGRETNAQCLFAIGAIGVFALHSMVDYPFRSMAMACLGAICAGMLIACSPSQDRDG